MKRIATVVLAMAMVIALSPFARADSITGSTAIAGIATFTSTGINFHNPAVVLGATGSLAIMPTFSMVTMFDITFGSAVGEKLFQWNGLGSEVDFTILSFSGAPFGSFLNISGTGLMQQTGKDPTPYNFTYAGSSSGMAAFELNAQPVPEPGSLLLLGSGLLGVAMLLFRKARKPLPSLRW